MIRRPVALAAILSILIPAVAPAQMTMQGVVSVELGGNTWSGVTVSGGLQSGPVTEFYGMKQQATWLPQWVDIWNPNPAGTGLDGGQAVSWTADFPAVGGVNRCSYKGNVRIVWWLGTFRSVYIDYQMTQTFVAN
jgi:hypothetical protein